MNDFFPQNHPVDEESRNKELSTIDQLLQDVMQYATGAEFMEKLNFYTRFPYIGAYNAALVEIQRPGARFLLNANKWEKEYARKIKSNARPVIILIPFYPVDFLFDVVDTEPIDPDTHINDNKIIEDIISKHIASCQFDTDFYLQNLKKNLPKHGIKYLHNYISGSEIHAKTEFDGAYTFKVEINKDTYVVYNNVFSLCVNINADGPTELARIFHELAHIFCHHITYDWWKPRSCEKEVKEFEAEVVSYLVCARLGINYNPTEYLAEYVNKDMTIPSISLEHIFRAVDIIEQAATGKIKVTNGLLYKKDPKFKDIVDKEIERIKKEKELKNRLNTVHQM